MLGLEEDEEVEEEEVEEEEEEAEDEGANRCPAPGCSSRLEASLLLLQPKLWATLSRVGCLSCSLATSSAYEPRRLALKAPASSSSYRRERRAHFLCRLP